MNAPASPRYRYVRLFVPLGLGVLLAVTGFEFVTAPRIGAVSPSADGFSHDASLTVRVQLPGARHLRDLWVRLDGTSVGDLARIDGDALTFATGPLADGIHTVTVGAASANIFGRHLTKTWRFTVDTAPPPLALTDPLRDQVVTASPVVVHGESEPGAIVSATRGQTSASTAAGADGRFSLQMALPDGTAALRLKATDAAGNVTRLTLALVVDAHPPHLTVTPLGDTVKTAAPLLHVKATDAVSTPRVRVRIDGELVPVVAKSPGKALHLPKLTDGTHTVVVTATDRGGNVADSEQTFLVDSTEKFGDAMLTRGARGKDVSELQRKLRKAGVYKGDLTGVLGPGTLKAVKRFERHMDMTPDGVVGPQVVGALTGRIVIDLSECKLSLYLEGKLVKTYPVAVGQPAYPTPTGDFRVVSMAKNPTWIPPDSPWAKGLEPIPPGPGSPVGTRWIGTSAKGVGIHGTPSDSSIGTHASHGCIRMHMWDVENLFERVVVGMPIHIQP